MPAEAKKLLGEGMAIEEVKPASRDHKVARPPSAQSVRWHEGRRREAADRARSREHALKAHSRDQALDIDMRKEDAVVYRDADAAAHHIRRHLLSVASNVAMSALPTSQEMSTGGSTAGSVQRKVTSQKP